MLPCLAPAVGAHGLEQVGADAHAGVHDPFGLLKEHADAPSANLVHGLVAELVKALAIEQDLPLGLQLLRQQAHDRFGQQGLA